jgi:hypothetical protein
MSTEGATVAVVAPDDSPSIELPTEQPAAHSDDSGLNHSLKPTGLHSPPDSNNAMKLDGSDDSELSDLEDAAIDAFQPDFKTSSDNVEETDDNVKAEEDAEEEDIGEVAPDHWSGTVPVFRPTMHQFKDFSKFVCSIRPPQSQPPSALLFLCTLMLIPREDEQGELLWHEVRYHQDHPPTGMARQATASGQYGQAGNCQTAHQARYHGIQRHLSTSQYSTPAFLQFTTMATAVRPERTPAAC